jgi:hypothetical protein
MVQMNKMARSVGDFGFSELFDLVQNLQVTRAGANLLNVKPRPANLELRRGFFSYWAAVDWYKVLATIKNLTVAGSFKEAYQKSWATPGDST